MPGSEIILECVQVGGVLRVAAVDPSTLEEVVFQAPLGTSLADIERLAIARLAHRDRVRRRQRKSQGHGIVA